MFLKYIRLPPTCNRRPKAIWIWSLLVVARFLNQTPFRYPFPGRHSDHYPSIMKLFTSLVLQDRARGSVFCPLFTVVMETSQTRGRR
ncbi:hypothetical protein BDV59DRAFT_181606 [Aspergillus ambiguus]|uniref:uncharacterized protein n=1 Tax=Aspergillus ambiguus TaxID=176160 RepID=UPI003CCDD33A